MSAHTPRRRAALLLAALTSAVLTVTGCGSAAPPSAPAASADSGLAAKVPAALRDKGVITVGTDATYAPSEFLDEDGKTVIGFDVDLFNAVAAKLGLKTEWQSSKFDRHHPRRRLRQVRASASPRSRSTPSAWPKTNMV